MTYERYCLIANLPVQDFERGKSFEKTGNYGERKEIDAL